MNKIEAFPLSSYAQALKREGLLLSAPSPEALARPVTKVSFDSREVIPGTLFICKGLTFKNEYALSAKEKGASCLLTEEPRHTGLCELLVSDVRRAMAVCSNVYCAEAFRSFPLIGLTGTKGKSTTLYFLKSICETYCEKAGKGAFAYISTIDTYDGKVKYESHLTTPEAPELSERFKNAAEAGVFAMGMEVSSQALKLDRCYGVEFSVGAFLNFGIDHIGSFEHPDEEDYLQAKLRIFDSCRTCLVNLNTERFCDIITAAKKGVAVEKLICYSPLGDDSVKGYPARYAARNIRKEGSLTVFEIWSRSEDTAPLTLLTEIRLTMPGLFNAENALAAAIIAIELGIPLTDICTGLYEGKAAGRMELFRDEARDLSIIVDYAHNKLSYETLFKSCREEFPGKRIEILFGCPGGKGYQRREQLPEVVAKYADYAWITEEDPFMEDPAQISAEVLNNLERFGGKGEIIVDRPACIREAVRRAAPGTVLILAAKGRELYQHRGNQYVEIVSDSQMAAQLTGHTLE
ncbi:MAG: UDP-N-acetylmuramyl peptide synthase [Firmicutes bacterium]|nr:UDP-N-acetylmuramyl peptide synthase [Bacillota bacterium]